MKRENNFWGVLLLVGAAALLADKLGLIKGFGFWSCFWSVLLITILVKGVIRRRFGRVLFAAAFLVIVNDELLHLETITPWPVLLAALLGTIGLKLLFPGMGGRTGHILRIGDGQMASDAGLTAGNGVWIGDANFSNVFGGSVKYITGGFRKIEVENVFGSTEIFFADAVPLDGAGQVEVECVFGSVKLYVPSTWKVSINTENVMGSSGENGRACPEDGNELQISGDVVFGSLEVIYA